MKHFIALVFVCALARPVWACGGFFCDRSGRPVNQIGEQILFAADATSIEVHVRIQYQGSDSAFAWILPVRKIPTLSVGVDAMFTALEQATAPQFRVSVQNLGCEGGGGGLGIGCGSSSGIASAPPGSLGAGFELDASPGVDVISQGVVGPYETVVLQADDGAALKTWLRTNGYLLTPAGEALLDPYVMEHDYFVALKLRADATSSDIQPIVLRFDDNEPCVPLRLTAIAALDDMDVTVYLLGSARAVPTNYYEVDLDWARLDWMQGGATYRQLVSAAVDEAGGRAFVTEYAGSARLQLAARIDLAALRAARDANEFVRAFAAQPFPPTPQVTSILRRWIPEPEAAVRAGITPTAFYACLSCYASYLVGQPIDAAAAADDLTARVVDPLVHAQTLFDRAAWLTRLYTRISPAEMTSDPTFAFNASLPRVGSIHQAVARLGCDNGLPQPIAWTLPDGTIVKTYGRDQGLLASIPAASEWRQMSASGAGMVVGDHHDGITRTIAQQNAAISDPTPDSGGGGGAGCGCHIGDERRGVLLSVLALALVLALAFRPRRR